MVKKSKVHLAITVLAVALVGLGLALLLLPQNQKATAMPPEAPGAGGDDSSLQVNVEKEGGAAVVQSSERRSAGDTAPGSTKTLMPAANPRQSKTITGKLVNYAGTPVQGASMGFLIGDWGFSGAKTRANGDFVLRRTKETPDGPARITAAHSKYPSLITKRFYIWGERHIRLQLPAFPSLHLQVVEAATGKAVEHFGVRLSGGSWEDEKVHIEGRHLGGMCEIKNLRPGQYALQVEPKGGVLASFFTPLLHKDDGQLVPLQVELAAAARLKVLVHYSDGSPVPGTRVDCLLPLGGAEVWPFVEHYHEQEDRLTIGTSEDGSHFLKGVAQLTSGTTDARGLVELAAKSAENAYLRIRGEQHAPKITSKMRIKPGSAKVDVLVDRWATLKGMVQPLSALSTYEAVGEKQRPLLLLHPMEVSSNKKVKHVGEYPAIQTSILIKEDGSFHCVTIPPGSWKLRLYFPDQGYIKNAIVGEVLTRTIHECAVDRDFLVLAGRHGEESRGFAFDTLK